LWPWAAMAVRTCSPCPGQSASDELVMRSQGKWPSRPSTLRTSLRGRLRGCRRRCRGRERLAFLIVVFYCHDVILMPFHTRLFPPLPSNAAAAGALGRWFVARPSRPSPLRTSLRGRLRGCRRRCRGRERLAFFIVVFYCHDAILVPFPNRLFPPLPSNAAAAGALGRWFVARWLRPLTWPRPRPWRLSWPWP
jgi:hypothetical protein